MSAVPSEATTLLKYARIVLGQEPGEWINERKTDLTYREIADAVSEATDGDLVPSHETCRTWHRQWVEREFVDRLEAEVTAEKAS